MRRQAWIGFLLALAACRPDVQEAVRRWLLCDECNGGEAARLLQAGDRAVPLLTQALRDGPSTAQLANIRAQAGEEYSAARRFRERQPGAAVGVPPLDSLATVNAVLGGYVNGYRIRAMAGLDTIRTAAAIDSLRGVWVQDSVTPAIDPVTRETLRAYAHGVTGIRLAVMAPIPVGASAPATVTVRTRPGTQVALAWTIANPALATVNAAGGVTGLVAGTTALRVCVVGLPAICALTPLQIQ